MALTPGEMLKLRQIASVNPSDQDPAWQALSEAQTAIAQARTDRLGITVSTFPGATKAIPEAPPGFYAPAAAKIVLDGSLLPDTPDRISPATDSDDFENMAALHGVFVHECGHAIHSQRNELLLDEDENVQMAATLLEEIRMEAMVVLDNQQDASWLRHSARNIILSKSEISSEQAALASHVLVLGRVAAGSLKREDVATIEKDIRAAIGDDVFSAIEKINKKTIKVLDDDHEAMVELGRELAGLFPKTQGRGQGLSLKIKEVLDDIEGGGNPGDLEDILKEAEARGEINEAIEEISNRTVGSASGEAPGKGERLATDEERRARNDLFLKFRQVRWRDRHLVERSSVLPPGRLDARAALQRSAEKDQGKLPQSRPWRQKRRRQEDMPRISCGVLIDTSGSMGYSRHQLSGSLWALAHAAFDNQGRVAGALFGNTSELLWGPEAAPPRHVLDISPSGGTEYLPSGIELLDNALDWNSDRGPRLLVIVSDGWWADSMDSRAAISEIQRKGVKVIQVGISMTPQNHGANQIVSIDSPGDLAQTVGQIAIEELRAW